jgi:hypothetical protein
MCLDQEHKNLGLDLLEGMLGEVLQPLLLVFLEKEL